MLFVPKSMMRLPLPGPSKYFYMDRLGVKAGGCGVSKLVLGAQLHGFETRVGRSQILGSKCARQYAKESNYAALPGPPSTK